MRLLATYPSSSSALRAEHRLKASGLAVELIPVPRQVRSNCGFCLLVDAGGSLESLRATGPDGLWRVLDPEPGTRRRRYEPYP